MICVEMMKLDLISDFLLPLLPEINGVWTNFWISFVSVYYNYSGCYSLFCTFREKYLDWNLFD